MRVALTLGGGGDAVKCLLSLGILIGVASLYAGEPDVAAPKPSVRDPKNAELPGWKLVWSDEFDKDGPPDPKKWGYEVGWVRNGELQYYTENRPENARVENGCLVIEGRKEHFANPQHKSDAKTKEFAEYTSASLTTQKFASWTYGRIE